MPKNASEIVDRALTLIDEVTTTFDTAATTETSVREMALEILPELCRDLIKELPWGLKRYLAVSTSAVLVALANGEDQTNYFKQKVAFTAPIDFWELVSIRLTVWAKPVTEYIYINSESYPKQNNPHTRAGKQNPVVALNNTATGGNARIECFSVNNGDAVTIANFDYVSFNNVPDDSGNDWPDELFLVVTKALATELNVLKSRMEEANLKVTEITNALEQHK